MQPYNFCLALCHLDIRRGSDVFCIPYPGFRRYRASTPGLRYAAHIRGLKFRLADARIQKAGSVESAKLPYEQHAFFVLRLGAIFAISAAHSCTAGYKLPPTSVGFEQGSQTLMGR